MKSILLATAIVFCLTLPSYARGPKTPASMPPFVFHHSVKTPSNTVYFDSKGNVAGRSFGTPKSTYWNRKGETFGYSFETPSGNSYFKKVK